jgi:response regulator RpfG family c-di-GMP phosphodiesterase
MLDDPLSAAGRIPPTHPSRRVLDVLVGAGLIKPEQQTAALEHINRMGDRAEEAVIELGYLSEADLLKALAAHYKTNFVSTEKLAKADIPPSTLDLVPRKLADTHGVFPVVYDAKNSVLSVVTADPGNLQALQEVQLSSGAREVKAIVARPAAVKAAILKTYGGDIHAFALLDRQAHAQFHAMLDVYERNLVSDVSMTTALAKESAGKTRERLVSEKQLTQSSTTRLASVGMATDDLLELLNVLVSLIEGGRAELRGHSAFVARLMRQVADRMQIDPASTSAMVAAGYLHDLGKMGQYHLTALNVSEYEGHKVAAQKAYGTPARLLESVHLSPETIEAITRMYERYDGKGFPDGTNGKDIPLAARILAITDTYADLTQSPRNPFRKQLTAEEACKALEKHRGSIFDPNLVDLFRMVIIGEDLRARLLANRYNALIVDTDPEETTVIELRLIEQGFVVKSSRTVDQAVKILEAGEMDLVISELDLDKGDGLKLLAEARRQPWGKDMPWVIYARRHERGDAQKAFELGVLDFVAKPAATDVLVAKLKALLDQRASPRASRGIAGSLKEMGLPEMVQALAAGKKSGNLKIRSGGEAGEIHFIDGHVVNALWGEQRGEDAFYAMLGLTEGDFGLDPAYKPSARVIHQSSDALLLEGMRRLDEGLT